MCIAHKTGSMAKRREEQYFTHFYSGFYPKRSHRASVTTMEPAFNEEEWQASIVSAHFHEGFFPSQSGSFFLSLMVRGGGGELCLGRFISLQLCWYPREMEVKDFFVCSFGIVAHKKDAHCGRAVLKGLFLCKTSLLLQGWCDLLLLLEWSSFAPGVVNCLW